MIKRCDRKKYFKYKYILMEPMNSLVPVLFLLICTSIFIPDYPILSYPVVLVAVICLILNMMVKRRRINDYLVIQKIPFDSFFYLYQSVKSNKKNAYPDYYSARSAYLKQMRQVLKQLHVGNYRTVTQPMFTRAILEDPRVDVIKKKKVYRKRINVLTRQIYSLAICPKHNSYTQFYYIEFRVCSE